MAEVPDDHPVNSEVWMRWTSTLAPGSDHARAHGCICSPEKNVRARELSKDDPRGVIVVIHKDCPMHGQRIPFPADPDYEADDSGAS